MSLFVTRRHLIVLLSQRSRHASQVLHGEPPHVGRAAVQRTKRLLSLVQVGPNKPDPVGINSLRRPSTAPVAKTTYVGGGVPKSKNSEAHPRQGMKGLYSEKQIIAVAAAPQVPEPRREVVAAGAPDSHRRVSSAGLVSHGQDRGNHAGGVWHEQADQPAHDGSDLQRHIARLHHGARARRRGLRPGCDNQEA